MFFTIMIVPITAMILLGGPNETYSSLQNINPELLNPFSNSDGTIISNVAIISMLAWGLGYFGQPHILVSFMAIRSADEIRPARQIAMVWVIFSLAAAVLVGMIGRIYVMPPLKGTATETVFMVMANDLFVSFIPGIVMSGVLVAIMSTASSQLIVTSSSISQDFYKVLIRRNAGEKELVWVNRLTVVGVAAVASLLAINPDNGVLDLVAYAWAGFGAAFGPTIAISLFWKRMTKAGALSGIVVDGTAVLVWKQLAYLGGVFELYEIVPGFLLSCLAIYTFSRLTGMPCREITEEFEQVDGA
jgi:sodium/proline symporter